MSKYNFDKNLFKEVMDATTQEISDRSEISWSSITPYSGISSLGGKESERYSVNGQILSKQKNREFDIWKKAQGASSLPGTNVQRTIESLLNLRPGEDVYSFDIENLGTFGSQRGKNNLPWYMPTELGFVHGKVQSDMSIKETNKQLSLLIRPTNEVYEHLDALVRKAKGKRSTTWQGFTDDERRTLNDLILYGEHNPLQDGGLFEQKNGVTYVKRQNRRGQSPDNFMFTPSQIKSMELGLQNLRQYGNSADTVASEILSFFGGKPNFRLGGFNIQNYDIPMMMDYLEKGLGQNIKDTKIKKAIARMRQDVARTPDLDVRQIFNVLYKDKAEKWGSSFTQEALAEKFGLNKGTAHMAVDDASTSFGLFNKLVSEHGLMDIVHGRGRNKNIDAIWDNNPLKVGDRLFSTSGIGSFFAGKHDAVYRMNQDGVFETVYDMKQNPLSKNTEYTVEKMFQGKLKGGKKHYGLMLKNEETGYYHFLARENVDDLRNVIQQTMSPIEEALSFSEDSQKMTSHDRARRRWDKMFSNESGGGRRLIDRMFTTHDAYNEGRAKGLRGEKLKSHVLEEVAKKHGEMSATPELFRDYSVLKGRLGAERKYIEDFLKELDRELPINNKNYAAQNMALKRYREEMDEALGSVAGKYATRRNMSEKERERFINRALNKSSVQLPEGRGIFAVEIDGKQRNIDLTDLHTTTRSINSALRAQHVGKPAVGEIKRRLTIMLEKARTGGTSGLTQYEYEQIKRMIDNLRSGDKHYAIVEQLSAYMQRQYRHNADMGLNTIDIEDPTKMTDERKAIMEMGYGDLKEGIFQSALSEGKVYKGSRYGDDRLILKGSLRERIGEHRSAINDLMKRTAANKSSINFIDPEDTLKKLVDSFTREGIESQVIYDKANDSLYLAAARQEDAKRIFGMKENEIIKSNRVAAIPIPMLDRNGNIVMPGQQRMGRMKAYRNFKNNRMELGTAFEEVVYGINKRAGYVRNLLLEGDALRAESTLKAGVREDLKRFSINSKYMGIDDMDKYDNRKSAAAKWIRSSHIDIADFAEDWYSWRYSGQGATKRDNMLNSKKQMMKRDKSLSFYQTLNTQEMHEFNKTIDRFIGLKYSGDNVPFTNMHNVKDTHAMGGLRSTADVRQLIPFGFFNPMARENLMKSVNYMQLDREETIESLRRQGVPEDKIERMMRRGLTTTKAEEVLAGETNYLNVRAARIDNVELQKLMEGSGEIDARVSTFDGQAVISEDIAKAFTAKRSRNIKLTDGAHLNPEIEEFFKKYGKRLDDGSWVVDEEKTQGSERVTRLSHVASKVTKEGSVDYGKITVGTMVRNGETVGVNFDKNLNPNTYIKGFDATRGVLELETRELVRDSTKMNTDSGDRITLHIKPREWFEKHGINADILMEDHKQSRAMHGVTMKEQVSLVLDEVQRRITVGDLQTKGTMSSVMSEIKEMLDDSFDQEDMVEIRNDQLVMKDTFGIDGSVGFHVSNLERFMEKVEAKYDLGLLDSKIRYAQVGLARADVYDWEDQIGYTENREGGLVRYGYKEINMIKDRANQRLGTGNNVSDWLDKHISEVSRAQGQKVDEYIQGLTKSVLDVTDTDLQRGKIAKGEVLIRSRGDSFMQINEEDELIGDREGTEMGRMVDGHAEVSMHAYSDLPTQTQKGQKFGVKDYSNTIIRMSEPDVTGLKDATGADASLSKVIQDNGGTALFEIPDDTFSRRYVRFVDTELMKVGIGEDAMPVLKKLQKSQLGIWRNTKEYQSSPTEENHERLQKSINEYEENLTHIMTSARDGSVSDMRSARMDMSGRFRIQGINAFANSKTGQYEDGTAYVGTSEMRKMIRGAEEDIARAVGLRPEEGLGVDQFKEKMIAEYGEELGMTKFRKEITSKVLDHATEEGLYGFVNRYPTINQGTIQTMKVKVDETIVGSGGRITVGTAAVLKADHDGDFFSTVLAHYKSDRAGEIHEDLQEIWDKDVKVLNDQTAKAIQEMEKDAAHRGITVGELWKQDEFRKDWLAKVGEAYDKETMIARTGKGNVGVLDNMRQKLYNLASSSYNTLASDNVGRLTQEYADKRIDAISEFGRAISQNAISSKKFSIEKLEGDIRAQIDKGELEDMTSGEIRDEAQRRMDQQNTAIEDLKAGITQMDAEGKNKIKSSNEVLGLMSAEEMDQALEAMDELRTISGGNRWIDNPHLGIGRSEGLSSVEELSMMMRSKGDYIGTAEVGGMAQGNEYLEEMQERGNAIFERSIVSNYDMAYGEGMSMGDSLGTSSIKTENILAGATVAEGAQTRLRDVMGKFAPDVRGGMMGGSIAFGAMWAASALIRSGPTPEGLEEQTQQAPPPPSILSEPTARITENNGEHINIRIAAKDANGMSQDDIAALVQAELGAMTQAELNMNMNVQDNTQDIANSQWLQGVVANAINTGFGF